MQCHGTGRALATSSHAAKTVKIVMHDPGCHWFKVHGKLATEDTETDDNYLKLTVG